LFIKKNAQPKYALASYPSHLSGNFAEKQILEHSYYNNQDLKSGKVQRYTGFDNSLDPALEKEG
jgi:hypothetical protein